MTPRTHKLLSALLLTLATLPALADQADSSLFSQAFGKLAQASSEERRALRERWEQASPEERIRMRQFIQDRVRQLPSPAREALRMPFAGGSRQDSAREREDSYSQDAAPPSDSSFGFGFERRRSEENRPERSNWQGNRRHDRDERR